jgi:predicted nucleic-acid-binding protein
MNAVDANVIVRLITRDDADQGRIAADFIREGVFVSDTVLMETEWVLRSKYRKSRSEINDALRTLLDTETVSTREPASLAWALDRHAAGADWADMLHLLSVRELTLFATFDRKLRAQAGPTAPIEIISL